jgi:6-pyruvoyltetrahydropterin/6-carboxytetrahydropterin synthase
MLHFSVSRYHDISMGHRVCGHENKCRHLHGHNYRITFHVEAKDTDLDCLGHVVDFGVIKDTLCQWLEDHWDHKFLLWEEDPMLALLMDMDSYDAEYANNVGTDLQDSIVPVSFNPTAENIGTYLVEYVGPWILPSHLILRGVKVEETRKCSATVFASRSPGIA